MGKLKELLKNKEKMKHYISYLIFGVLATIVDFGVFYLLRKFIPILDENIANAIAIFIAIVFAYFTNRVYVFKSKEQNILKEFIKFFMGRMSSSIFNVIAFWILSTFTDINEILIKAVISVVVIILNYILSKLFVFKEES